MAIAFGPIASKGALHAHDQFFVTGYARPAAAIQLRSKNAPTNLC